MQDLTEGLPWRCPECDHAYDRDVIEHTVVDLLSRQSLALQLQDLVCVKCHMVKAENASAFCSCSGQFVLTSPPGEFITRVQTAYRLAEFHNLPYLRDTTAWLLQLNGLPLPS